MLKVATVGAAFAATGTGLSAGAYTGNQLWTALGLLILFGLVAWMAERPNVE